MPGLVRAPDVPYGGHTRLGIPLILEDAAAVEQCFAFHDLGRQSEPHLDEQSVRISENVELVLNARHPLRIHDQPRPTPQMLHEVASHAIVVIAETARIPLRLEQQ